MNPYIKYKDVIFHVIIIYCALGFVQCWKTSNISSSLIFDFLINYKSYGYLALTYTLNNNDYLLIFGGQNYDKSGNIRYSNQVKTINLNTFEPANPYALGIHPQGRHSSCGFIYNQKMYIYGGIGANNVVYNDLWSYDMAQWSWKFLGNASNSSSCVISIRSYTLLQKSLVIFLTSPNQTGLQILQYSFTTNLFSIQAYTVQNKIFVSKTKLWDNTNRNTYYQYVNSNDFLGDNMQFSPKQQYEINVKHMQLSKNNYAFNNNYMLLTDTGNFFISVLDKSYTIKVYNIIYNKNEYQFTTEIIGTWIFIFTQQNSTTRDGMELSWSYQQSVSQTNGLVTSNNPKLIDSIWLPNVTYFQTFTYSKSLFVLDQNLNAYVLDKNCGLNSSKYPNILSCVFGMYTCKPFFAGPLCSLPMCPGSLQLLDVNNVSFISFQCSGNGKCTSTGCLCNQNWVGQACDHYNRKTCYGDRLHNFIQNNCQCNQSIVGGNNCQVKFCYNDCAGKGICNQDTGTCDCETGYEGPDCTILSINFQLI